MTPDKSAGKLSPCATQTADDISAYYRAATAGTKAAIRHTQHGLLRYEIVELDSVSLSNGRAYTREAGSFYLKSGKNCFHPKGQTSLVVPTASVVEWAAENPDGAFDYRTTP